MKAFLDKNKWEASIATKWAGCSLQYHDELVSTNLTAADLGKEGVPHGTLVVADKQTGGRGRRGRTWESPAGKNLYFSLLLRPKFPVEKASMLTLVMAHSVARAIEKTVNATSGRKTDGGCGTLSNRAGIKWPNDILWNGRKVCGILTEMKVENGRIGYVIIGVGVNVHPQNFEGELADKASALEQECGCAVDREVLLQNIMHAFEQDYEVFAESGDLKPLQAYYHSRLLNKDAQVRVLDPQEPFEGIARGITENGELLVECKDGIVRTVYAGEVSVRGLSGYV